MGMLLGGYGAGQDGGLFQLASNAASQDPQTGGSPGPRAVDDPRNSPPVGAPPAAWQARDPQSVAPADTPTAAAATLNPNQQYVDAFNASLSKQRGAIDSTLAANLGAMGHRRDLAATTVAAGAKDVQMAANNQQTVNAQSARGVDANLVPGAAKGANANAGLYQGVINSAKSTDTQVAPMLQLGVQANYDTGAAQLRSAATTAQSALDQKSADFAMQQASQQADYAHQAAATQTSERFTLMQAGYSPTQIDAALAGKGSLPQLGSSADALWYQHANYTAGLQQQQKFNAPDAVLSKTTGGAFTTQAQLEQFTHDPNYLWAKSAIEKGGGHPNGANGPTLDQAGVLKNIHNGNVIAALVANHIIDQGAGQAWIKANPGA